MGRGIRISIGILAWNEEDSIGEAIGSVLSQDICCERREGIDHVEVICLPNGCTDRTADRAREALGPAIEVEHVTTKVCELSVPSKQNAWNAFVHRESSRQADYLVFMDGDVFIDRPRTLSTLIRVLESDREARLAGARTIKHIERTRSWNPLRWLSAGTQRLWNHRGRTTPFAGALYCARASLVRRFSLPKALTGDDAFIHAMTVTDLFTRQPDGRRVVKPPDATVVFETYMSPVKVFRNLRRRMVEYTINSMVYDELWEHAAPGRDAGTLLEEWSRTAPDWGDDLIRRKIDERGWWVVRWALVFQWVDLLRRMPLLKACLSVPVALVGTLLYFASAVSANHAIRSGRTGGLWFSTRTSGLCEMAHGPAHAGGCRAEQAEGSEGAP